MDVDNLGSIFIKGFGTSICNFADYASLSSWLDSFFKDSLSQIIERDEYKPFVNIIYAGGDDIFVIGRWDKLILFAHEVREQFGKYVGQEMISISGGIAIVGDKFPIAKAAELAGDAEDAAKKFNNGAKDAFNLFGETVTWGKEFDFVKQWEENFVTKCDKENMPRSILHKLMTFAEMKQHGEIKYVWNTVYYLKRFSERGSDAIKPFCDKLAKIVLSDPRNYDLIAVAARWAELELRDNRN